MLLDQLWAPVEERVPIPVPTTAATLQELSEQGLGARSNPAGRVVISQVVAADLQLRFRGQDRDDVSSGGRKLWQTLCQVGLDPEQPEREASL